MSFTCANGQAFVKGKVTDLKDEPLPFANVFLTGNSAVGVLSDIDGNFYFGILDTGAYELTASYAGFEEAYSRFEVSDDDQIELLFKLRQDVLELRTFVKTGTFSPHAKIESSVSISTVNFKEIEERSPQGTGELMSLIPGVYVDNSSGNLGSKVYVRGLTTGVNSIIGVAAGTGFRYISLQEDGLPIMSTNVSMAAPDFFHRIDGTVSRLEAIRGGSSSISAANSPGGIFNFISKVGKNELNGQAKMTYGLYNNGNALYRSDVNFGGPMGEKLRYHIGGFYRRDDGTRVTTTPANVGGQVKANLVYLGKNSTLTWYAKHLNDRNTIYGALPAVSPDNITAQEGFDIRNGRSFSDFNVSSVDYSKFPQPNKRDVSISDGAVTRSSAAGFEASRSLNGWTLNNNFKFSRLEADVNKSEESNTFDTDSLLNDPFPRTLYDAVSGNPLEANEISDKLLTSVIISYHTRMSDFMDQVSISKETEKHRLTLGAFGAYNKANVDYFVNAYLSTFNANPKVVAYDYANPYIGWLAPGATGLEPVTSPERIQATSPTGSISLNVLPNNESTIATTTMALFANDVWTISDRITLDAGIRLEMVNHKGSKRGNNNTAFLGFTPLFDPANPVANPAFNISEPVSPTNSPVLPNEVLLNGADGDPYTMYDETSFYLNDEKFDFDIDYQYWAGSLGINYKLSENAAMFVRGTRGVKAPDIDYYVFNFDNIEISEENAGIGSFSELKEEIIQSEVGAKIKKNKISFFTTFFYNNLRNIPINSFGSTNTGLSFFTPTTFSESRTFGLETELNYTPVESLNLRITSTIQDSRWKRYFSHDIATIADSLNRGAALSNQLYLDNINEINDKTIADIPNFFGEFSVTYKVGKLLLNSGLKYTGKRAFNANNAVYTPGFYTLNAAASLNIKSFNISIDINNITNTVAFTSFSRYLEGSLSIDALTTEQVNGLKEQNAPILGYPIRPRFSRIAVTYNF